MYQHLKKLVKGDKGLSQLVSPEDYQKTESIYDVIDHESGHRSQPSIRLAGYIVESSPFRLLIVLVIFLDGVVVCLQTSKYMEERYGAVLQGLGKFFLTLFVMEMLLKLFCDFLGFWTVNWNIFDFAVIILSFLLPSFLGGSRVVHGLRVLHATRSLRSIGALTGLQTVILTIFYSIPGVANVLAVLSSCMFMFAIFGFSFFGESCKEHFGSFEKAMFSLFICITQDGWLSIRNELNSCGNRVAGALYLVVFISIGAFVLANFVVAVLVTNLERVIEEQNRLEKKLSSKKSSSKLDEFTPKSIAHTELMDLAKQPLKLNLQKKILEKYLHVVLEMEFKFAEFKKIRNQLIKIQQEVHALENLDDMGNEDIVDRTGASGMYSSRSFQRFYGDTRRSSKISDLRPLTKPTLLSPRASPSPRPLPTSASASNFQHVISQLISSDPSSHNVGRTHRRGAYKSPGVH